MVAAGTELSLAAAEHADALTIKSILVWSYTKVGPGTISKTVYELDDDSSLLGLFGDENAKPAAS